MAHIMTAKHSCASPGLSDQGPLPYPKGPSREPQEYSSNIMRIYLPGSLYAPKGSRYQILIYLPKTCARSTITTITLNPNT